MTERKPSKILKRTFNTVISASLLIGTSYTKDVSHPYCTPEYPLRSGDTILFEDQAIVHLQDNILYVSDNEKSTEQELRSGEPVRIKGVAIIGTDSESAIAANIPCYKVSQIYDEE